MANSVDSSFLDQEIKRALCGFSRIPRILVPRMPQFSSLPAGPPRPAVAIVSFARINSQAWIIPSFVCRFRIRFARHKSVGEAPQLLQAVEVMPLAQPVSGSAKGETSPIVGLSPNIPCYLVFFSDDVRLVSLPIDRSVRALVMLLCYSWSLEPSGVEASFICYMLGAVLQALR